MWAHPKHQNKSILIKKNRNNQKQIYSISHMFAIHLLT